MAVVMVDPLNCNKPLIIPPPTRILLSNWTRPKTLGFKSRFPHHTWTPKCTANQVHPLQPQGGEGNKPNNNSNNNDDEDDYDMGVKVALSLLNFYKREISPVLPRSCRYVPTCSEYFMEAYKKYGFVKGTVLSTWRLCRCNPLGGSGFDPPRWFDEEAPPPPYLDD